MIVLERQAPIEHIYYGQTDSKRASREYYFSNQSSTVMNIVASTVLWLVISCLPPQLQTYLHEPLLAAAMDPEGHESEFLKPLFKGLSTPPPSALSK